MKQFDQEAFNRFMLEHKVYGFFDQAITLKSGRQSHFYANWRTVVEDVWLTEKLVEHLLSFVEARGIAVDTFYGVPEGATKLGVLAQYTWARKQSDYGIGSHALAMGRAKPKEHGAPKDRFFVGTPRGKVVMIEDVTTTGGSTMTALEGLRKADIEVSAIISLTNRMEKRDDGLSVADAFKQMDVDFYQMSSALELLPQVYAAQQPGAEIGKAIEGEFEKYGVARIELG